MDNLIRVVFISLPASLTPFEHLLDIHNVSDKFECLLAFTFHYIAIVMMTSTF